MPQTGYTPIELYYSSTASNVPTAANLKNGELAINITDGILFYKDNTGTVQTIASKASTNNVSSISFGSTGLTPSTATNGVVTVAGILNPTNGGLGVASLTGLAYGNGTSPFTAATASQIVTAIGTTAVTNATNATNILSGTTNQIAYQTAAGTTSFITAPTVASTYLQWNGSAFTWATIGGGTASSLTINNGGAGAASPASFNGSSAVTISYNTVGAPSTTGTNATGTWGISISGTAASATTASSVTNSATFNNSGSGAASGSTFNGSSALTISYNTIGAPSTTGTNASGTWGIGISGNAATATTATNQAGGAANQIQYNTAANTSSFITAPTVASTYLQWNGTSFVWATAGGTTTNSLTFNNGGAGGASGTSFNGSTGYTISYNTIGAPSTNGTNATGTWGISISGTASLASAPASGGSFITSSNIGSQSVASAGTLTSTLGASLGGTGLTSPGTSGNVLTSNGSAWTSSAPVSLGVGQTWTDVSSSRTSGTTYTNSTGKPIMVAINGNMLSGINITVGGVTICTYSAINNSFNYQFVVPIGATYSFTGNLSSTSSWIELR